MPPERPARSLRAEGGQSLTEIALSLPILAILLIAIIQYGVMIWQDIELTGASREGARRAVVARVEDNPEQSVIQTALASLDTVDPEDVEIDVDGGWDRDDTVTVTVSKPHSLDIAGLHVWDGTLRSTSTVRIG